MEKLTKEQIENLPEWMTIPDYPSYEVNCRKGIVRNSRTLRVRKPCTDTVGYPKVTLCKDGRRYPKTVHRLVANAAFSFYNISTDGLLVMHLDEERNDPRVANLALGTNKENMNFEKARKRLSEWQKGENAYWFGKSFSEEHRKKMSEAMKGEKHPMYGKHHSAEARMKMSEARHKKAVGAYKNGVLVMKFESIIEASRNGFNNGHVSSCCRDKRRTHRGFYWKYL